MKTFVIAVALAALLAFGVQPQESPVQSPTETPTVCEAPC